MYTNEGNYIRNTIYNYVTSKLKNSKLERDIGIA